MVKNIGDILDMFGGTAYTASKKKMSTAPIENSFNLIPPGFENLSPVPVEQQFMPHVIPQYIPPEPTTIPEFNQLDSVFYFVFHKREIGSQHEKDYAITQIDNDNNITQSHSMFHYCREVLNNTPSNLDEAFIGMNKNKNNSMERFDFSVFLDENNYNVIAFLDEHGKDKGLPCPRVRFLCYDSSVDFREVQLWFNNSIVDKG